MRIFRKIANFFEALRETDQPFEYIKRHLIWNLYVHFNINVGGTY